MTFLMMSTVQAMDLKGVSPGDPYDAKRIAKAFVATNSAFPVRCNEFGCLGYVSFGSIRTQVSVLVLGGRVDNIIVTVSPGDFDQFVTGLKEKFGEPKSSGVVGMQNGFGAKFDSPTYLWVKDGQQLLAEKYHKSNESQIRLSPVSPEAPALRKGDL